MSISSEITRLQNAKASIKTSIEGKGVTVPSATKLDGYSTLIDSIQTGITPTGTISITTNGTVDVTNYASADVNVSGGGSSSPIQLLDTITVSSNVRGVSVDVTPYSSYDFIFIFENITLSASDWLYYKDNTTTPSGGSYSPGSSANHVGWCGYVFNMPSELSTRRAGKLSNTNFYLLNSMDSLFIYTYTASKTIQAGSEIYIYGGNYADL